jgi:hypothetical protein
MLENPFDLAQVKAYECWRGARLEAMPRRVQDLLVQIADPWNLSESEHAALLDRVRCSNMAVFAAPPQACSKEALKSLAARFGLVRLDVNQLADEDGISPLSVAPAGTRRRYIPYTDRPIAWHTDGYYNDTECQVQGLMLWCQRPALEGGGNALLDPELAYIALRERDPAHIEALMRLDAFAIPPNEDADMTGREMRPGPVFSMTKAGKLHMRYTARKRSIAWNPSPDVQAARAALEEILADPPFGLFEYRLEAGQGLLSNNVLHTRTAFRDDPAVPRLLWRARFYDRISES